MTKLTDQNTTELTEQKKFEPTPHMRVWLDTAVQLMTDNITEIETASKVTAQAYYKWIKDDQFLIWFKEEWDRRIRGHSWKLDAIGMKQAKRDHKYWESMQKRVGNLHEDKSTKVQVNNFMPILGGASVKGEEK